MRNTRTHKFYGRLKKSVNGTVRSSYGTAERISNQIQADDSDRIRIASASNMIHEAQTIKNDIRFITKPNAENLLHTASSITDRTRQLHPQNPEETENKTRYPGTNILKSAETGVRSAKRTARAGKGIYRTGKTAVRITGTIAKFTAKLAKVLIQGTIKMVSSLLSNPAVLTAVLTIAAGIALMMVLVMSASAVMNAPGSNDSLCSSAYVSDGNMEHNRNYIWNYLRSKGISEFAAAGILGNIQQESEFNPGAVEKNNFQNGGIGLIQITYAPLKADFLEQAQIRNVKWDDMNFQLDYIYENFLNRKFETGYDNGMTKIELEKSGFWESDSPTKAARIFHDVVEHSADTPDDLASGRLMFAENIYRILHGTSGNEMTDETIIWIGDSRTVQMSQLFDDDSRNTNNIFVAKSAQGYNWFIEEGMNQVRSSLSKAQKIVFNLGVNDLHNIENYISLLNELSENEWKNKRIIVMSVNPVDESRSLLTNQSIEAFNEKMKNGLNPNISYIDTYSRLSDLHYDSEGIHYSSEDYRKIYSMIRPAVSNACIAYGTGYIGDIPDFSNTKAWILNNPLSAGFTGQCTWYTYGCLLQYYGDIISYPTSNGDMWVNDLTSAHPDYFKKSDVPVPGSVYSATKRMHVGFILDVQGNMLTIFEGNLNGDKLTDTFEQIASGEIYDWEIRTVSLQWMSDTYGAVYAVPTQKALQERKPL